MSAIGTSPSVPATRAVPFVITQTELHAEVLSDLVNRQVEGRADQRWVTGVLVECVRSVGGGGGCIMSVGRGQVGRVPSCTCTGWKEITRTSFSRPLGMKILR